MDTDPSGDDAEDETEDEDEAGDAEDGSDGSACFVATCAYGSRHHPDVAALRLYRDLELVRSRPGRAFIKLYYRHGARLVGWLRPYPRLIRAVRWGLASFFAHLTRRRAQQGRRIAAARLPCRGS